MKETKIERKRAPTHPGELLREVTLPAARLNVSEFARRLHVSRDTVHGILRGSAPVTANIAVRLAALFGTSAEVWLNMQSACDLWAARERNMVILRQIARQPIIADNHVA